MSNHIEKAIIKGALKAAKDYDGMAKNWLSHAPESFVMVTIANYIVSKWEKGDVYMDCSPKKIRVGSGTRRSGRPSKYKRYDLVIWRRASKRIRAVVEIKKNPSAEALQDDRDKLHHYRERHRDVAIYVLAYTEAKGKRRQETLVDRGARWEEQMGSKLVETKRSHHNGPKDEWDWALHLFRIN